MATYKDFVAVLSEMFQVFVLDLSSLFHLNVLLFLPKYVFTFSLSQKKHSHVTFVFKRYKLIFKVVAHLDFAGL